MPKLDTETARSVARLKAQVLMDKVTIAERKQRVADAKAQLAALQPKTSPQPKKRK